MPLLFSGLSMYAQGKFFGGNGDGYASASLSNIVLPVRWISFSAKGDGRANYLSWKAEADAGNHVFEVERSEEGIQFAKIGEVQALPGQELYHFTDSLLLHTRNYYRLRTTGATGQYLFSKTILVETIVYETGPLVFPNPAGNTVFVLLPAQTPPGAMFELVNSSGQLMQQVRATPPMITLDLGRYPAGLYIMLNRETGLRLKIIKRE